MKWYECVIIFLVLFVFIEFESWLHYKEKKMLKYTNKNHNLQIMIKFNYERIF